MALHLEPLQLTMQSYSYSPVSGVFNILSQSLVPYYI